MSTLLERRRAIHFQAKARACKECLLETTVCQSCGKCPDCCFCVKHSYFGSHNVWYGEQIHACECGFESHEKAEVEQHIAAAKAFERAEEDWLERPL